MNVIILLRELERMLNEKTAKISDDDKVLLESDFYTIKETDDDYEYIEGTPGVVILPLRKGKNSIDILLRNEEGVRGNGITCITGRCDEGEDFLETAIRELKEEAGIVGDDPEAFHNMGELFYGKSHVIPDTIFFVFVDDFKNIEPTTDGTEYEKKSNNFWVSLEELDEYINDSSDSTLLSVMSKLNSLLEEI